MSELSREMFYGINKLNLKDNELVSYLSVLFESHLKKVAPTENEPMFKGANCREYPIRYAR